MANYWFQPASGLDFLLWTAAAVATTRGRDFWVPALLVIGAVNRETSVFIVLIYAALRFGTVSHAALALRCGGLFAIWAALQGAVRAWVGPLGWAGRGATPLDYLTDNFTHPDWMTYAAAFFGVLWLAPALALPRLPPVLKRLLVVLLPYLVLQFMFGRIREVRLFLPLALALVPIGLIWLRDRDQAQQMQPD